MQKGIDDALHDSSEQMELPVGAVEAEETAAIRWGGAAVKIGDKERRFPRGYFGKGLLT